MTIYRLRHMCPTIESNNFTFKLSPTAVNRAVDRPGGTEGFSLTWCTVEGNVVSVCPLKRGMQACLCLCVCVYYIFKHLSACVPQSLKNQALALTRLRSRPWKRWPLALFRDRSHSWCGSIAVHTPMIIHSGVIVLHISPLARRSVTVTAGHTWVIQGSAVLISTLQWRCWWGKGYLWLSLRL